jgi:1-acyl-sn-glycerol-3-phosphate acyltransferase
MFIFFIIFIPIIWVMLSFESMYRTAHYLRCWWGKLSLWLCLYFYKVEWETDIDKKRNYVIVFNHTSHLDILLLFAVLKPMYIRFMAKAELAKVPIFGKFFRTIDLSVNREDATDAARAFQKADAALENGDSIAIAPEGGTSKNPPHLRDFKSGAFRLAIQHQIPILVLTIYDNWRIMPSHAPKQGWHISRVKVHAPIETKNLLPEQYKELSDKVRYLLQQDLQQAFPEKISK